MPQHPILHQPWLRWPLASMTAIILAIALMISYSTRPTSWFLLHLGLAALICTATLTIPRLQIGRAHV